MFVGKYVDEGEPDRPAPPIGSCHASIWSRRCRKSLADRGFRRGGDGAQVVTLGAGHQLGDGEHPGSAGVWFFPGLGRGPNKARRPIGNEASATQADHGQLAPGYQLVGEGPGDPEQLTGLGGGVDEAIVRCLWRPYGGGHGRHVGLWTSTKTSTETSTAGISSNLSVPRRDDQGGQGRRSRGARRVGAVP